MTDVYTFINVIYIHVHVPIRLYTNCDYNNTLYYMLLELQLKQDELEGLLNPTLQGYLQEHLMVFIIL